MFGAAKRRARLAVCAENAEVRDDIDNDCDGLLDNHPSGGSVCDAMCTADADALRIHPYVIQAGVLDALRMRNVTPGGVILGRVSVLNAGAHLTAANRPGLSVTRGNANPVRAMRNADVSQPIRSACLTDLTRASAWTASPKTPSLDAKT